MEQELHEGPVAPPAAPLAAEAVFGPGLAGAERFAARLVGSGVQRGLLGPREADRVWDRHLLNSAVVAELVPTGARVLDVGSGAGLPGIALALARPDLSVALLEPMARRVAWLEEVVGELDLPVAVHRGRAENAVVRRGLGRWDVVTARAVAPLGRLAGWCLPLLDDGGRLLAVKGASAAEEARRDAAAVRAAGGGEVTIRSCGEGVVDPPATVAVVPRRRAARDPRTRTRKDRRA